jgi:hypothetical protein
MAEFNIDYLPIGQPIANRDGTLSDSWQNYFRSLHNVASNNFNASGTHLPTIDPDSLVLTPTGQKENGAAYYNKDNNTVEVIVNGERHTFNTTVVP